MIDREFCDRLNKNVELLVERFAEKYWDEMPTISCVEGDSDTIHWNYYFNDSIHFTTEEMFSALWYNIPRAVLFAWCDIQSWNVSWPKVDLVSFYKISKD